MNRKAVPSNPSPRTVAAPFAPPRPERPLGWPAPQRSGGARVALAIERSGPVDWSESVRELVEAAGARIEWTRAARGADAVPGALDAADAVVVASLPDVRAPWSRRYTTVVRCVSNFGSSLTPGSLRHLDLLLVGATDPSAGTWERSVRLACAWTTEEERKRVHCAVRDPGWPILGSDRAIRFRRIASDHPGVEALRTSHQDARRRLLFDARAYEALVADAADLPALVRAACASAGWCSAVPALHVGDAPLLLDLDLARPPHSRSAEGALAVSLALVRLLRRLGEGVAAAQLASAVRAELADRRELARDLWLDLASETPRRFVDAVQGRLVVARTKAN